MQTLKNILLKAISYETAERIKTFLSCLIYLSGFSYLYFRIRKRGATILLYHSVGNSLTFNDIYISKENFIKQMDFLKKKYKVMPLKELLELHDRKCSIRRDMVAITFDDGYKDNYSNAFPILQQFGFKATFFITTGLLSGCNLFYDIVQTAIINTKKKKLEVVINNRLTVFYLKNTSAINEAAKRIVFPCRKMEMAAIERIVDDVRMQCGAGKEILTHNSMYISNDEIEKLKSGGMDIGAHTVNHLCLAAHKEEIQRAEIAQSQSALETVTRAAVDMFSYPFGKNSDYDSKTVAVLRELGFSCAVTTMPGNMTNESSLLELPRVGARNASLMRFKVNLHGIHI